MRNTTIFLLVVLGLSATMVLLLRNGSRRAFVEGRIASSIYGMNHRQVYLVSAADSAVLDSCLVQDNRFSLSSEVFDNEQACLVTLGDIAIATTLHPDRTVQINLAPDLSVQRANEEALSEAIARLDSNGITIPDSIWLHRRELE